MKALVILLSLISMLSFQQPAVTAESIVERADSHLSPDRDFSMLVSATDREPGKADRTTKFRMLARGRDQTLLMTLWPESKRGRNLLYNALDLWVYLPSVRRPFKISLQERLTGEASNSDLARTSFSRDYKAALAGMEEVGERRCYKLDLAARSEDAPYSKAILWVEVETFLPVKIAYYAVSGRLLKECFYDDYRLMLGVLRPTRLTLKSATSATSVTVLEYSQWKEESLNAKFFDKSYIDKMKY
jgi:hypothetical protein